MSSIDKIEKRITSNDGINIKADQKGFIKYLWPLPIEFAIFLTFFSINLTSILYQNLVIELTCKTIYGYDPNICHLLGAPNTTEMVRNIEDIVQPYSANVMMTKTIGENVIPAVIGLFLGAWSDKFGRKPILLLSITGFFLNTVLAATIAGFASTQQISPWLFLIPIIPSALAGGVCTLLGSSYAYVADITISENRSIRVTIVGLATAIGILCGLLGSGPLVQWTTAQVAFVISSSILLMALVTMTFVPESLSSDQIQRTSKFRGFFQWRTIRSMLQCFFKKRDGHNRMIMWMSMTVLSGYLFAIEGPVQVFYLYLRSKYSFTSAQYTTYNACFVVTLLIGTGIFLVLLQKIMKLSMPAMILCGLAFAIVDSIVKTASPAVWLLYANLAITGGKGVALQICRTFVSFVVPADELGKIYSLSTALEFITPLISAPVYTAVYNATLDSFPEAFNLISLAIYSLCFALITILYVIDKRSSSTVFRQTKESE